MSPSFPNRVCGARRGFTLIELLTVIAIIAILMGLLFPALNGAKEAARKAEARSACTGIVTAVKAYQTEYGVYPLLAAQQNGNFNLDTVFGNPNGTYPNAPLFNILRAIATGENAQNAKNPRQVIYIEGSNIKDPANPRSGFNIGQVSVNNSKYDPGSYFDPWGNTYVVFIDANYDNSLNSQGQGIAWFYNDVQVQGGAAACSIGKDHIFGSASSGSQKFYGSDDVASW